MIIIILGVGFGKLNGWDHRINVVVIGLHKQYHISGMPVHHKVYLNNKKNKIIIFLVKSPNI